MSSNFRDDPLDDVPDDVLSAEREVAAQSDLPEGAATPPEEQDEEPRDEEPEQDDGDEGRVQFDPRASGARRAGQVIDEQMEARMRGERRERMSDALDDAFRRFITSNEGGYFAVTRDGPAWLPDCEKGELPGRIQVTRLNTKTLQEIVRDKFGGGQFRAEARRGDNTLAGLAEIEFSVAGEPIPQTPQGRKFMQDRAEQDERSPSAKRKEEESAIAAALRLQAEGADKHVKAMAEMQSQNIAALERAMMSSDNAKKAEQEQRKNDVALQVEQMRQDAAARDRQAAEERAAAQRRHDAEMQERRERMEREKKEYEDRRALELRQYEARMEAERAEREERRAREEHERKMERIEARKRADASARKEMLALKYQFRLDSRRAEMDLTGGLGFKGHKKVSTAVASAKVDATIAEIKKKAGIEDEVEEDWVDKLLQLAQEHGPGILAKITGTPQEAPVQQIPAQMQPMPMLPMQQMQQMPVSQMTPPAQQQEAQQPPAEPGQEPAQAPADQQQPQPAAAGRSGRQIAALRVFLHGLATIVGDRPAAEIAWETEYLDDGTTLEVAFLKMAEGDRTALETGGWETFFRGVDPALAPNEMSALQALLSTERGIAYLNEIGAMAPWAPDGDDEE